MIETAQAAIDFASEHRAELALGALLFVATLVVSLAVVTFILVKMPPDYLQAPEGTPFWPNRPVWMRIMAKIGKNLLGLMVIALGVVQSVPGVPGQGLLTILIGVMLMDFPGKRRFERRLLGRPGVLAGVNRLRARFQKPPIVLHPPAPGA